MENRIDDRPMTPGEETEIFDLVSRVFLEHVAPLYSETGIAKFFDLVSPAWLHEISSQEGCFVQIALKGTAPVGVVAVVETSHIALFFVESGHQGQGVGRRLMEGAVRRIGDAEPASGAITVNASPNSRPIYRKLGFQALGDEIDEEGLLYTPMSRPAP